MAENFNFLNNLRPLIARLIQNFLNGNYDQRRESAIALSKFKGAKATDFLLETYESDNIQDFMALALGNIDNGKAINLLINALNDSQQEVRFNAAQALGMMENKEAFNTLMEALNDYADSSINNPEEEVNSPETQFFFEEEAIISAIVALGKIRNRLAISLLKRLLAQEKSPRIRASIIMALGMMPSDRMLPVFQGALRDEDPRVRANAIEAIESLKSGSIVGIIQPYLEDPSNRVKANVAKAIWKYGDFDVSETLKQMLEHKDKWYRASATYAIGEIKDSRFIPQLAKALKDEDSDVRRNATTALRKIEYNNALPHLQPLLNDPNFDVRVQATLAIFRCAKDDSIEILREKLKTEENFIVQATLISCLGQSEKPEIIDEILKFLESEDPRVVSNTIDAIANLSQEPKQNLIETFKKMLSHEDNRVKSTVIKTLWLWGEYSVLENLQSLFNADEGTHIRSATFVLGEIGKEISQTQQTCEQVNEIIADLIENPQTMDNAIAESHCSQQSESQPKEMQASTDANVETNTLTQENQSASIATAHPIKLDNSFDKDLEQANNAVTAREYDLAKEIFEKILQEKPDHLKAILGIANLYFIQKEYATAATYYENALKQNPNLVKAHYNLGTINYYEKKYDQAVNHLVKALNIYPKILGAYLILAQIYQIAGKTKESIALLTKAVSLSPRNPVVYQKLAFLHIQSQDFVKAIEVLTQAISLSPLDVESNLLLAYCFQYTDQSAKAFSAMDLTLKACTQSPNPENSVKQLLKTYLYINSTMSE